MRDWKAYVRTCCPRGRFRGEVEDEILEELAVHLDEAYREARGRGATEAEAERRALEEVEDWYRLAAEILETRRGAAVSPVERRLVTVEDHMVAHGGRWIIVAGLLQELRYTLRRTWRAPAVAIAVVLTLGIGIGANTAVFSVVKGVLLNPLPYDEPDQLVAITNSDPRGGAPVSQSIAFNAVYETDARVFQAVGLWYPQRLSLVMGKQPEEIGAVSVTHGLFRALRATPILGRPFTADDSNPGSPVVILSHAFWQNRLGGTADVLGRTLELGSRPAKIIGVMPAGFRVLGRDPDLYLPLVFNRATLRVSSFVFPSIARLQPGVSPADAARQLAQIWPLAPQRYPGGLTADQIRETKIVPAVTPLKPSLVGDAGRVLWVILGGVATILLVACANVAGLLLVRSDGRRREYFIQSALGCSRLRAVGQVLAESVLLGIAGGVLGLGLAYAGLRVLVWIAPANLPRLDEIGLDPGALLFTLAVSFVSGLLPGLMVSAQARRGNQSVALVDAGAGLGTGRARNRLRHALVVVQMASALVLLVASGLMVRSLMAMTAVNPGFSSGEELLTFQITIPSADVPDDERVGAAHEALASRLREISGVATVGVTTSMPMDGRHGFDPIHFEDFPLPPKTPAPIYRFKWVGGGYPDAMGTHMVAGRPITWEDVRQRAHVVMITENLARERWGHAAKAVGRRVSTGTAPGDWREIVGVVADVRDDGVSRDPVPIVFWPIAIEGFWREVRGDQIFVTRTAGYAVRSPRVGTPGFLDEVRRVVLSRHPTRPLTFVRTMASYRNDSMARTSFLLVTLAVAAAVTLALGVIGLFGVMSYVVGCRTREIGLRMAVGATRQSITGLVLRQGVALTTAGVALGLGASYGLTRLMRAALFGVAPVDPLTYIAGALVLATSAIVAAYLPARRAARTDPYTALRAE